MLSFATNDRIPSLLYQDSVSKPTSLYFEDTNSGLSVSKTTFLPPKRLETVTFPDSLVTLIE